MNSNDDLESLSGSYKQQKTPEISLRGSIILVLVDPIGIEPTTSTLPVWRSPS